MTVLSELGWLGGLLVIGVFVVGAFILAVALPFRLGRKKIICPKCREFVLARPHESHEGEEGGECPACGEWFPLDTWERMAGGDGAY